MRPDAPRRPTSAWAAAMAAALVGAPTWAALALAASDVVFRDAAWGAVAGFLAGALLRRAWRALPTSIHVTIGAFLAALAGAAAAAAVRASDGVPPPALPPGATATAACLALGLFGEWIATAAAVAVVLVAFAAAANYDPMGPFVQSDFPRLWADVLLAAGALAAAELASRRRRVAARVVVAASLVAFAAARVFLVRDGREGGFLLDLLPLLAAPLAGAVAAETDAGARPDDGAAVALLLRRRPWRSAVLVAGTAALCAARAGWSADADRTAYDGPQTWLDLVTLLPLLPAACALLPHCVRTRETTFDALAPWLAAGAASVVAAAATRSRLEVTFAGALGMSLFTCLWPIVVASVVPVRRVALETPFAAVAFPAAVLLVPPLFHRLSGTLDAWSGATAAVLVLLPFAFHAVVETTWSAGRIVAGATILGVASFALRPTNVSAHHVAAPAEDAWILVAAVWALAGLAVVVARRCRGMSAVPTDHPVIADFGGA